MSWSALCRGGRLVHTAARRAARPTEAQVWLELRMLTFSDLETEGAPSLRSLQGRVRCCRHKLYYACPLHRTTHTN